MVAAEIGDASRVSAIRPTLFQNSSLECDLPVN